MIERGQEVLSWGQRQKHCIFTQTDYGLGLCSILIFFARRCEQGKRTTPLTVPHPHNHLYPRSSSYCPFAELHNKHRGHIPLHVTLYLQEMVYTVYQSPAQCCSANLPQCLPGMCLGVSMYMRAHVTGCYTGVTGRGASVHGDYTM